MNENRHAHVPSHTKATVYTHACIMLKYVHTNKGTHTPLLNLCTPTSTPTHVRAHTWQGLVLISHVHPALAVPRPGTLAIGVEPLLALARDNTGGGSGEGEGEGGGGGGGGGGQGGAGGFVDVMVVAGVHELGEDRQAQREAARELEAATLRILSQLKRLVQFPQVPQFPQVALQRQIHGPGAAQGHLGGGAEAGGRGWGGVRVLVDCLRQVAVVKCKPHAGVSGACTFDAVFTHHIVTTSRSPHTRSHRSVTQIGIEDIEQGHSQRPVLPRSPSAPRHRSTSTAHTVTQSSDPTNSFLRSATPPSVRESPDTPRQDLHPNTPLWKMAT
jgi:hypothetical protein